MFSFKNPQCNVPGFAASSGRPMPSAFVGRPTQHDRYQSLDLQEPSQALRKKGIAHPAGWCPPVINWFINPMNTIVICVPKIIVTGVRNQLSYLGGPTLLVMAMY